MSVFHYILSIALGQGIILAFFLLTSKYYRSAANTYLAIALILISTISIVDLASNSYDTAHSFWAEFFLHDLELGFLAYIPLYYFFKIATTDSQDGSSINFYLFLPFLIDTVLNLVIVSYYPIETIATHPGIQLFYEIETFACIGFNAFVSYRAYQLIQSNGGHPDKQNWIYRIWQSTIVLLIIWALMAIGGFILHSALAIFVQTLYLVMSSWMFWLIYNGIVNLKLIDDRKNISLRLGHQVSQQKTVPVSSTAFLPNQTPKESVASPQLPPNRDLFEHHYSRINHLMVTESLYRNEDLSIDDVAQRIDMSPGYISKIIKTTTSKNFPIWINEFRVAEVKVMFTDTDFNNYTTLSIGLEAGFKSKSAFYAAFKKITGETPARYRKKTS